MKVFTKSRRAQNENDWETWIEGGVTPTLNAFDNATETRATVLGVVGSVVRRLTPVECERLQGFPDDWTAQRYDYKKQQVVNQADSNRYKQMGNAVAVPVVDWIVNRLVAIDANDRQA